MDILEDLTDEDILVLMQFQDFFKDSRYLINRMNQILIKLQ